MAGHHAGLAAGAGVEVHLKGILLPGTGPGERQQRLIIAGLERLRGGGIMAARKLRRGRMQAVLVIEQGAQEIGRAHGYGGAGAG